jgi:hypothetical protein
VNQYSAYRQEEDAFQGLTDALSIAIKVRRGSGGGQEGVRKGSGGGQEGVRRGQEDAFQGLTDALSIGTKVRRGSERGQEGGGLEVVRMTYVWSYECYVYFTSRED